MTALSTPILGVNVDRVDTAAEFALGTKVVGTNGTDYTYVVAGEAISTTTSEPFALGIDENFTALKGTAAGALDNHSFGIAPQLAIASGSYFWARAMNSGYDVPLRVAASVGADVVIGFGASATAGRLQASVTASAGNAIVMGVMITDAASASASAGNTVRNAIVNNPIYKTAVAN